MSTWKKIDGSPFEVVDNHVTFETETLGNFAIKKAGGSDSYYHFYTSDNVEITDISVSGLADAYYYTKGIDDTTKKRVGGRIFYINEDAVEGTDDKFYVYDNTDHTTGEISVTGGLSERSLGWGYSNTTTGVTSISGKTNTQTILNMGVPTDRTPNIWEYIKDCRDNNLNGCNDWFIMSNMEQNKLRASGLVNWYSRTYLWNSVEYNSSQAYYWNYSANNWKSNQKVTSASAFAGRSF